MLTIITTPKPLDMGDNRLAFQNAIRSWVRLSPRPEILVFGGDRALVENEGGKWIGNHRATPQGRPYFDDFINRAEISSANDVLMYCTDHLILTSSLLPAVKTIADTFPGHFVVVGKRWGLHVQKPIDFSNPNWECVLWDQVLGADSPGNNAAKDYIIFRRPLGLPVPNFIMGYPWYDTWLVWAALQANYPVIDASDAVIVVHQSHKFIEGDVEKRENTPGGQHNHRIGRFQLHLDGKVAISQATHVLTPNGVIERNG